MANGLLAFAPNSIRAIQPTPANSINQQASICQPQLGMRVEVSHLHRLKRRQQRGWAHLPKPLLSFSTPSSTAKAGRIGVVPAALLPQPLLCIHPLEGTRLPRA